jgi:hypothetical protein
MARARRPNHDMLPQCSQFSKAPQYKGQIDAKPNNQNQDNAAEEGI